MNDRDIARYLKEIAKQLELQNKINADLLRLCVEKDRRDQEYMGEWAKEKDALIEKSEPGKDDLIETKKHRFRASRTIPDKAIMDTNDSSKLVSDVKQSLRNEILSQISEAGLPVDKIPKDLIVFQQDRNPFLPNRGHIFRAELEIITPVDRTSYGTKETE